MSALVSLLHLLLMPRPVAHRWGPLLAIGLMALSAEAVRAQPSAAPEPTTEAAAPEPQSARMGTGRPRVGLVLSGGGARGFAHIGVLKALEEARVPVDAVVGTSMGAIVGGLYASGMRAADLEAELMRIDWPNLFDRRPPRTALSQRDKEQDFELSPMLQVGFRDGEFRVPLGAISSRSLEWLLRRYTLPTRRLNHFDALPTPFRAVATDMETGEPVVLESGDLAAALRASMSVPGVFSPLEWNDRLLGDGGLVNNLPVDVARSMGVDVVIAVNIGTPLAPRNTLNTVLGISTQMVNILTEQNVQRSIALLTRHDLLLTPQLDGLSSARFDRAPEILALGHAYAQTVQASLERFAVSPEAYALWQLGRQPLPAPEPAALAFVRLEGVPSDQARQLARQLDSRAGQALDAERLNDDLQHLAASGDHAQVDYRLEPDPGTQTEGLVFALKPSELGPHLFTLGLDLRTDFRGDSGFNLRLNHRRRWLTESGTEWRSQVELGAVTALDTELYHPWGGDRDRFVALGAGVRRDTLQVFDAAGAIQAQYSRRTESVSVAHGWTVGKGGQLGSVRLGLFAARRLAQPDLVQTAGNGWPGLQRWREQGLRLKAVADRLDHANFPQTGYRVVADAALGIRHAGNERVHFERAAVQATRVFSHGRHTLNLYARAAHASDVPIGALDEYSLGGFHQLSGHRTGQVAGNLLALLRVGYYQRLALDPGLARALFAGGTLEAGNAWQRAADINWRQLRTGASLYVGADTAIGPVYLALVHGKGQRTGLYLFLGRP